MNLNELNQHALELKDAYQEYERRNGYKPWGAQERYNSLVSDVGDLGRLILAKEGFRDMPNLEKNLSHELGEILWAVLMFADMYGVDLAKSLHDEVEERKKILNS